MQLYISNLQTFGHQVHELSLLLSFPDSVRNGDDTYTTICNYCLWMMVNYMTVGPKASTEHIDFL